MTCERTPLIHALADGELSAQDAAAARDHLADCAACQAELAEVMQLDLAVAEVTRRAQAAVIPLRRRRWQPVAVGAALMAAGVMLYFVARPRLGGPERSASTSVDAQAVAMVLPPHRASELRLSWAGAAAHRPYEIARSAETPTENVPLGALSDLDRRKDWHGVGALALLNGDNRQAEAFFQRAPASADLSADRAALALAEAQPERALAAAEDALRAAPGHPGATWNRALALRDLGLALAAAAAFREVAARNEPGWSQEAEARAAELTAEAAARRSLTERVLAAGPLLSAAPQALALDDARRLPGLARVFLYDAVRSASPAQLTALQPMIEAVDGPAGALAQLAQRARAVASRAPGLAATYGELVAGRALGAAERQAYLGRLRAARADDLLIGALIRLSPTGYVVSAAELPELSKLTAASSDPWFKMLGLEQRAHVTLLANHLPEAEAVLLRARQRCQAKDVPAYRCLRVGLLLSEVYGRWQRVAEARAEQQQAWKLARAEGEWLSESKLLGMFSSLATIADDATGSQRPLARAYAEELSLREPTACDTAVSARYDLALTAINQLRFEEARRELRAAPACDVPADPQDAVKRVLVRVHLVREALRVAGVTRVDGAAAPGSAAAAALAELSALRGELSALRQAPTTSAAQRAFLDHNEGRLIVDVEPAAGEALLRQAIAAAHRLAAEPAFAAEALLKKTAAFSTSVLVLARARAGDGEGALAQLAQELGTPVPARCALGIAVEDQRRMAVVRDADGQLLVHYDEARASTSDDPRTAITAAQLDRLAACPVVDVLARPPVHGTSRLLPERIAWRYLAARRAPLAPRAAVGPSGSSAGPSVVVADVEPPASLGLPRLATWQSITGRTLSGASATPQRVLAALAEAGEVIIHAHGLGSRDAGDAAFLALSADDAGRYALTAADVRATALRGSPLVVLAACSASLGAPVLHEPWSLPAAFVFAGARAVIASSAPIPDREASELVDGIRAAIAAGSPAAVALRDARQRWLAAGRGEWVRDLMVFE